MTQQTAQKLIDRATEYQLAQLALKIGALTDEQLTPNTPEIRQLREIVMLTAPPTPKTPRSARYNWLSKGDRGC